MRYGFPREKYKKKGDILVKCLYAVGIPLVLLIAWLQDLTMVLAWACTEYVPRRDISW